MKSSRTLALPVFAAGALVLAAGTANAQESEPFAGIPHASDVLIRIDMERLAATPSLAPIVNELRAMHPNFQNFIFETAADENPQVAGVLRDFPGTVKVYEMGLLIDSIQGGEPQAFMIATGDFDAPALHERLTTTEGWTEGATMAGTKVFKGPEGSEAVMTMPNANTLLFTPSEGTMGDLVSSFAASSPSARDGAMSSMVGAYASSPVFVSFQLPAEAKEMLAQLAENPPAEAAAIPGGPALVREGASLEGAVLTLGGQGSDALFGLALDFVDGEAAGRASSALNNLIPGLAMMAQMQAGDDPEVMAQVEQFKDLQFTQSGTAISVQIPIPPDQLQMAIAGAQEAASGGMMGMMGGGPGPGGNFGDPMGEQPGQQPAPDEEGGGQITIRE